MAAERLLERRQARPPASDSTVSTSPPSDLHGEQAAAADGDAVEEHRARAAHPVLAADVRPREPEPVPQEVREDEPRLDGLADDAAVDRRLDLDHDAASTARRTSVPVSERRYDIARVRRPRRVDQTPAASAPHRPRLDAARPDEERLDLGSRVGRSVTAPTATRLDDAPSSSRVSTPARHRLREVPVASANSSNALASPPARGQTVSTTSSPGASVVREVRHEEVVRGDLAPAARAVGDDGAAQRDEAQRQLRRAVGVGDRPADRSPVPRHEVADERQRRADERVDAVVVGERRLTRPSHRTQDAVRVDPVDPGAVQVDQQGRPYEPHVERGHEALAARDRLRVLPALGQRRRAPPRASRPGRSRTAPGFSRPPRAAAPRRGRGQRQLDVVAAERVRHRVRDRDRRRHRVALAQPFGSEAVNGDGDERWSIQRRGMSGAVGVR